MVRMPDGVWSSGVRWVAVGGEVLSRCPRQAGALAQGNGQDGKLLAFQTSEVARHVPATNVVQQHYRDVEPRWKWRWQGGCRGTTTFPPGYHWFLRDNAVVRDDLQWLPSLL